MTWWAFWVGLVVSILVVVFIWTRNRPMGYEYEKYRDNTVHWIARHLPKRLIYWCAIVLGAHATTGEYGHQLVPDLTFMDAIKRYGSDYLGDGDGQCKRCLGAGCPACDARQL